MKAGAGQQERQPLCCDTKRLGSAGCAETTHLLVQRSRPAGRWSCRSCVGSEHRAHEDVRASRHNASRCRCHHVDLTREEELPHAHGMHMSTKCERGGVWGLASMPHGPGGHEGVPPLAYAPKEELCGAVRLGPRLHGPERTGPRGFIYCRAQIKRVRQDLFIDRKFYT